MEQDAIGYPQDLWRKMADLGWLGLPFDEANRGSGCDLTTVAVLLEELGRVCDPTPYFAAVVLAGLTIEADAGEALKTMILPRLASGQLLVVPALLEETSFYRPEGIQMRTKKSADAYLISGAKLFVTHAAAADHLLTAVRTGSDGDEGITFLLVDAKSPGISLRAMPEMASGRQFEVLFENVEVPADAVVGPEGKAWPQVSQLFQRAAALQCALQLGMARRMQEMTVDYAKMRVQFGRPIGSFQAVQHHCANMWMDTEAAWLATYRAVWCLDQGLPAEQEIAIAKAWTSEATTRTCLTAHQIHGGVGFMQEYDLQLWTRRAKAMELTWGTPLFHRRNLARLL